MRKLEHDPRTFYTCLETSVYNNTIMQITPEILLFATMFSTYYLSTSTSPSPPSIYLEHRVSLGVCRNASRASTKFVLETFYLSGRDIHSEETPTTTICSLLHGTSSTTTTLHLPSGIKQLEESVLHCLIYDPHVSCNNFSVAVRSLKCRERRQRTNCLLLSLT